MGTSYIYIGDSGDYLGNSQKATDVIVSTGWHKATSEVKGRYISLRRDGLPADTSLVPKFVNNFTVSKIKVFQCPNLLDEDTVSASITADTSPASGSTFVAQNLLDNLQNRVNNMR